MSALFDTLYADTGRASIVPEKLMRAQLEHRSGLVRSAHVSLVDGRGEREAALAMLRKLGGRRRRTLAADTAYDTADFVAACRALGVTPHVAQTP